MKQIEPKKFEQKKWNLFDSLKKLLLISVAATFTAYGSGTTQKTALDRTIAQFLESINTLPTHKIFVNLSSGSGRTITNLECPASQAVLRLMPAFVGATQDVDFSNNTLKYSINNVTVEKPGVIHRVNSDGNLYDFLMIDNSATHTSLLSLDDWNAATPQIRHRLIKAWVDAGRPAAPDPLNDLVVYDGEAGESDGHILYVNRANLEAGTLTTAFDYPSGYGYGYGAAGWVNPNTGQVVFASHTERLGDESADWATRVLPTSNVTVLPTGRVSNVRFTENVNLNDDGTIAGHVAFTQSINGNKKTLTVEENGKLTLDGNQKVNSLNLDIKSGGRIFIKGLVDLNDGKLTALTTKGVNIATIIERAEGAIAGALGNDTIKLDPSVFDNRGTTIMNPALVLGSPTDSFNVIKCDVGSLLTVNNTITFNNQNVLVVGYQPDSITAQALTDIITANNMVAGTNSQGRFDYVFTLGVNEDGSSTGILQPIDATVTNNTGTYRFDVAQSNTGVKLSIEAGAEADAGSNLDSVVQQLLATNEVFRDFVNYNSTSSSFAYRLDNVSAALTNSAIAARNGSIEAPTDSLTDDFRFSPVTLSKNMGPEEKLKSILTALAQGGPIERKNNEYRVWVSPFGSQSNEVGSNASRNWLLGSLVGAEYRSKAGKYTLGLLGGMNFGNGQSKQMVQNGSNIKGINMGGYAAWGAWEGGRIDGLYIRSLNWLKESRFAGIQGIALNDHKATVDVIDFQTSHVVKFPGDTWSVRASIGHTYTHSDSQGYKEYNVATPRLVAGSIGRSYEVYGGLGLRYNKRMNDWRTRITGVYEYGKEYKKAQSSVRTSHGSNLNIHTFSNGTAEKAKTHYATLYGSVNNNEGWKFILGYQGGFKKNITDTSVYAKAEYRF